ncbi:uncharacterized protein LOC116778090 [Danaus plexippus]|uniref:uncharacterized protein LOC116778090 n=1 Tax=Danaus plexippus TaxID=13037 RepID=UPI002AB27462|nr:uncharacterized protein LOC116778090 [Danaus plexippus]
MDLTVDEFIEGLFSDEAHERSSDNISPEDFEFKLPEWFDEKKYKQGQRFYRDYSFMLSLSLMPGLVSVFAIPSILKVLCGSRRSNSRFTAYRRYISTFSHIFTWYTKELKPGSLSWKSLQTVRIRHFRASRAAKMKGQGIVSQRDMALTLFGFIGFVILKPDIFTVTQLEVGDWEAFNHMLGVIAHMIGLEDRYNICRATVQETREVCKQILDRVFTPCLDNVPEYFEHMSRVMIEGLNASLTPLESNSLIYKAKYLANVPGYITTEEERIALQERIKKCLRGRSLDEGVDSSMLIEKSAIDGLTKNTKRILYYHDYDTLESAPTYKSLPFVAKWKLTLLDILREIHSLYIGRIFLNFYIKCLLFLAFYFPYIAIWRYGMQYYVDMFKDSPVDDTELIPNSEYNKPQPPEPWYKVLYGIFW